MKGKELDLELDSECERRKMEKKRGGGGGV